MGGAAAGGDAVPAAQARWRTAEDKLYPMVMVDPDRFQHVLEAVRALVDELRRYAHSMQDLLDVEAAPASLLAVLPPELAPMLPEELMVQAACGLRGREVAAALERERRTAVIAEARAAGRTWVVIEGPQRVEDLVGSRQTALYLPTGRTLIATVEPFSGDEPFHLEEVAMAVAAERADGPPTPGRSRSFAQRAAWLAEHDRWRREIESS